MNEIVQLIFSASLGVTLIAPKATLLNIVPLDASLKVPASAMAAVPMVPAVCKKLGVTPNTYYRWRKEYGGLKVDQAKRLKQLERENARLKRLLADAHLDNAILKEVTEGNF